MNRQELAKELYVKRKKSRFKKKTREARQRQKERRAGYLTDLGKFEQPRVCRACTRSSPVPKARSRCVFKVQVPLHRARLREIIIPEREATR